MSQENNTNDQGAQDLLQLQLSGDQRQALTKMLPNGYSLEAPIKPKKESSHKPSKKLFTNEGTAIKKNGGGTYNQGIPTPNSTHSDGVTPTAKRVLREKKKTHSYLEDNFIEAALPLPTTSSKPVKTTNNADLQKKASGLIAKLKKHNCVGPFLFPVDVKGLGLYDYYDYVPEPMDLSTVEKKLKNGEYSTMQDFASDVKKIWTNALAYNAEGSSIYNMTLKISSYFDRIYREVEDVQPTDKVKDLEEKVKNLTKVLTELTTRPGPAVSSAKPANRSGGAVARSPAAGMDKPMSQQEKKVLCENIKKLPADSLRGVWEIVSKGLPNNQNSKEELIFDIDALPVKVTRELEKFVKSKMAPARPSKSKAKEPQAAKLPPATDDSYNDAYQYNHPPLQGNGGGRGHNGVQTQTAPVINKQYMEAPSKNKDDDAESKSSDSSFISDSESGSDDERKHKTKPAQNYLVKQQDLANFQAGGHGSMLNSFVIK